MKRVATGVVLGQALHGGVAAEGRNNCVLPQPGADWSVHRTEDMRSRSFSAEERHGPWPVAVIADASNRLSGRADAICHQPHRGFTDGWRCRTCV